MKRQPRMPGLHVDTGAHKSAYVFRRIRQDVGVDHRTAIELGQAAVQELFPDWRKNPPADADLDVDKLVDRARIIHSRQQRSFFGGALAASSRRVA